MTFNLEITDTFGGEPNYTWAIREQFIANYDLSDEALAQEAIKIMGWQDEPVTIESFGDIIRITPTESNLVAHVSWND